MSESELVIYYGLSVGAGLTAAVIAYAVVENFRHPSRISVFGWLEPSTSERRRLSIYIDNRTNARALIHEAGAILENGQKLHVTVNDASASIELPRPLPVSVEPGERTIVCIFSISRQDAMTGFSSCYVVRQRNRTITGPVHGQLAVT
jgi:hypothetical protein